MFFQLLFTSDKILISPVINGSSSRTVGVQLTAQPPSLLVVRFAVQTCGGSTVGALPQLSPASMSFDQRSPALLGSVVITAPQGCVGCFAISMAGQGSEVFLGDNLIVNVQTAGLFAQPPVLIGARFSNDGRFIYFTFDVDTNQWVVLPYAGSFTIF